jgi:hypothetical protein
MNGKDRTLAKKNCMQYCNGRRPRVTVLYSGNKRPLPADGAWNSVCVCVCVCIYIYIYVCVCVCVVSVFLGTCSQKHSTQVTSKVTLGSVSSLINFQLKKVMK